MATDGTSGGTLHSSFLEKGYAGPLSILSSEESKEALSEVLSELHPETTRSAQTTKTSATQTNADPPIRFKLHLILPALARIAHHPKLINAVQQALGSPDILLWSSDVNIKPANSAGVFLPHQDSTYAGLQPASRVLTAWVALSDPVGITEGCLSFYPGSHRCGQLPHETSKDDSKDANPGNNMLSLGQFISKDVLENNLNKVKQGPIPVELRCGQASLHSFHCVHASGPNSSPRGPRVGFALRYMTADVRQTKPTQEMATRIAGTRHLSHFDFEDALPLDSESLANPQVMASAVKRGREIRREAIRREEANYFLKQDKDSYDTSPM